MKIIKRNQIIISVIALMLITVGYMNYTSNITASVETGALMDAEQMAGIGDARLVNSGNVIDDTHEKNNSVNTQTSESSVSSNEEKTDTSSVELNDENNLTTQTTSVSNYEAEYFVSSRLERDKMYSQMIETYQAMLENSTISAEEKSVSSQEITNINNKKNSIMITENLIKNLGFEDVVVFVNESSVSVIVKTEILEEAQIAQIQNIVCREIGVTADLVHISMKK